MENSRNQLVLFFFFQLSLVCFFFLVWFAISLVQGSCSLLYSIKDRVQKLVVVSIRSTKLGRIFLWSHMEVKTYLYFWESTSSELAQTITYTWIDRCEENFQLIFGLQLDRNRGSSYTGLSISIFGWTFKERRLTLYCMKGLTDKEYLWCFESRWNFFMIIIKIFKNHWINSKFDQCDFK